MTEQKTATARSRWGNSETIRTAASWVVAVAGTWWILFQLASVLRPLLLAIFLAYVVMPYFTKLRKYIPAPAALTVLAIISVLLVTGVVLGVYLSLLGLQDDLPELKQSSIETTKIITEYFNTYVTTYLPIQKQDGKPLGEQIGDFITASIVEGVNLAAGGLIEAAAAILYLLFIILESARIPMRIRSAYPENRANEILEVASRINTAIISFIRAKVLAGLILAGLVWIVLALAGIKFSFLWAILTFLCNFIPYIGSVVAYVLPAAFALLQLQFGTSFVTTITFLLFAHVICATAIEPLVIGRAVGLSPLIVLASLSLWGLLWGLPGMFLAIPLTVVAKIVFEQIDVTRPLARLIGT